MSSENGAFRLPLLKTLKDLAKSGATLDASIVTTYAFNGLFYEEVLLRAFERAGSRLNIVLADAGQLAESLLDPLRRPTRAGVDYLLAPISHVGAFHPKIVALLSERQPILAVGSHNVTDAGFSHNEEVTAYWSAANAAPPGVLSAAVEYALQWLEAADALPAPVLAEITGRVRELLPPATPAANDETSLIVSSSTMGLWDQVLPKVVGPVRRVTAVGPYFDSRMDLFSAIARDLAPPEIVIAVQPLNAVMPQPDLAPKTARFVDASRLEAFWSKAEEVGFAHGKVLAIEAEGGLVVSLGSANPTGAAWLAQTRWNAEANICLTGAAASAAFSALGMDRLGDAPALAPPQLFEIAQRSQASRSQERAAADTEGPPLIAGKIVDGGILLSGFELPHDLALTWVGAGSSSRVVTLDHKDGGALVSLGDQRAGPGLHELRSENGTVALVLVNDAQALRAASLPRDGARILDHLGSLDSGAGFTDLLDLLDRHVLSPADGLIGASRPAGPVAKSDASDDSDAPFGPRGVSLPADAELGLHRPRLSDGLIADIIAALIRALGAPPPVPATDGDAPDLDEGDAEDGPSSEDLARNVDAVEASEIDWPRLVTACRRRLAVMLKRLEARLNEAADANHPPGWALGRLVVVLSLLHRLRSFPPQIQDALSGRVKPTSLVSAEQLASAFGLAVRALYGPGQLAVKLETAPGTRAAEERRLIDNLLLWFAREIGADSFRQPQERFEIERLQARADLGPVVMSAAAYEALEDWAVERDPWLAIWDDAAVVSKDWVNRHLAFGLRLQGLLGRPRPKATHVPVAGDLVLWPGEQDLPWVVASVSGHKVSLIAPAGKKGVEKKVMLASVTWLDIATLREKDASKVA